MPRKGGWYGESQRHAMAAKGVRTGQRDYRRDAQRVVTPSDERSELRERAEDIRVENDVDIEVVMDFIREYDDFPEGKEWFIYDDDERDSMVRDYIEESLWAFNPEFLSGMTGIDAKVFKALQPQCEGANDAVYSIVEATCGMDRLVEEAVMADGYGHFLSPYDGDELEFISGGEYYYAYRQG